MKAFFLDRDGVINSGHSINRPDELTIIEGVPEAIRRVGELGYEVFIVTNQGGVGLGYMKQQSLDAIHAKLVEDLENHGGKVRDIRACTHKPKQGCGCRKPEPGMILDLIETYVVDPNQSFMVGDRDVDIQAGHAAGVKTVWIQHGDAPKPKNPEPDYIFPSLYDAVHSLEQKGLI